MSLRMPSRCGADPRIFLRTAPWRAVSSVRSARWAVRMIAFKGVRISWLKLVYASFDNG